MLWKSSYKMGRKESYINQAQLIKKIAVCNRFTLFRKTRKEEQLLINIAKFLYIGK